MNEQVSKRAADQRRRTRADVECVRGIAREFARRRVEFDARDIVNAVRARGNRTRVARALIVLFELERDGILASIPPCEGEQGIRRFISAREGSRAMRSPE